MTGDYRFQILKPETTIFLNLNPLLKLVNEVKDAKLLLLHILWVKSLFFFLENIILGTCETLKLN